MTKFPIGSKIIVVSERWYGQKGWTGTITRYDDEDGFDYFCTMDNSQGRYYSQSDIELLVTEYKEDQTADEGADLL